MARIVRVRPDETLRDAIVRDVRASADAALADAERDMAAWKAGKPINKGDKKSAIQYRMSFARGIARAAGLIESSQYYTDEELPVFLRNVIVDADVKG